MSCLAGRQRCTTESKQRPDKKLNALFLRHGKMCKNLKNATVKRSARYKSQDFTQPNHYVHRQTCYPRLIVNFFFYHGATAPSGPRPPHYRWFIITLRYATFGRSPLDEWSARRRDLKLTKHNHKRQTSMPPGGIRTHNPSKWAAADPRLRPCGQRDRLTVNLVSFYSSQNLAPSVYKLLWDPSHQFPYKEDDPDLLECYTSLTF